jgi:hypothetical protein
MDRFLFEDDYDFGAKQTFESLQPLFASKLELSAEAAGDFARLLLESNQKLLSCNVVTMLTSRLAGVKYVSESSVQRAKLAF